MGQVSAKTEQAGELSLSGKRVAFVGRLLTCDQKEARRLVRRSGGIAVDQDPEVLVVAGGSQRSKQTSARVFTEKQFLESVGQALKGAAPEPARDLEDLLPSAQAARLYPRVTWQRRRTLEDHGLLAPVRLPNGAGYRFQDLRVLRLVDKYLAVGLRMPQIIVRLAPANEGQYSFRFPTEDVRPRPKRIDLRLDQDSADAWFDVGFCADRDRSSFPTAIAAYKRALEIDADHVPSLINLGNVYYEMSHFDLAQEAYGRACAIDPSNPRTHFNLGNASDELGDLLGAMRAYRAALDLWPGYADTHFNLALVAEKLSSWLLAQQHWQRFLELEPGSEWAAVARSHLSDAMRRANDQRPSAKAGRTPPSKP
ncbi:MAG: tetratricopeptide repeat protein [Candidatus Binatia bacterium]|nr:tetratricopeptide repeat protein [Candidatus Binatia bacterium]